MKPTKITDTWLGPYLITQRKAEVLFTIKPVDYEGPDIVVHACRLVANRDDVTNTKTRVPNRLVTEDQGGEMAEEIRPPFETSRQELGIPVQLGIPESQIVDFDRKPM